MGKKNYVCSGAKLRCSYGTCNGSLNATPKMVTLCGQNQANIGDHISMVNIRPFGLCRSRKYPATASATAAAHGHLTPMPCVPGTATPWSIVDANSILCGKPALLDKAKLKCVFGGEITIVTAGQTLETTEASSVEINKHTITVSDYFWVNADGEECSTDEVNAIDSPTLCLQTSLNEGDQLMVKLGKRTYPTTVGRNGVAKLANVDISEIKIDLPSKPRSGGGKKKPEIPSDVVSPIEIPTNKPAPKDNTPSLPQFPGEDVTSKPQKPKQKPATPPKPAEKNKPKPKETPDKPKPIDGGEVNETTIQSPSPSGWGDPVSNPKIRRNSPSHLYGKVRRNADGSPRNHQGFDYYAPEGTPILSVNDGVIYNVESGHSDYGLNITIRHSRDGGYVYSFYAHLSRKGDQIVKGKVVRKGDVIGYAGTTGNAKGFKGEDQHLHFESRTSPAHQRGLGGKENPNNIVATKFTAESLRGKK